MPRKSKRRISNLAKSKLAVEARKLMREKVKAELANCDQGQEENGGTLTSTAASGERVLTGLAEGHQATTFEAPESESQSLTTTTPLLQLPTCFVCCANVTLITRKSKCQPLLSPAESLHFFLHDLLEIPVPQVTAYLKVLERPENWIRLCQSCRNPVVNGRDLREEIDKLRSQLRQCKIDVLEKMKGTIATPRATMSITMKNFSQNLTERRTLLQIQNFVNGRQYSVLNPAGTFLPVRYKQIPNHPQPRRRKEDLRPSVISTDPDPVAIELESDNEYLIDMDDLPPPSPVDEDPLATTAPVQEDAADEDPVPSKTQIYCGLCDNNEVYENEEDLLAHTNKCHLPSSPPSPSSAPESISAMASGSGTETDLKPISESEEILFLGESRTKKPVTCDPITTFRGWRSSSSYRFYLYDCPNCPNVKKYSVVRYAQHLGIHLRRPYQCVKCLEFFPEDADLRENHWKDKHQDATDDSQTLSRTIDEKFTKIKLDPGKIWKCDNCFKGFFTEADRTAHELRCTGPSPKITTTGPRPRPKEARRHPCQLCPGTILRNFPEWRFHRAIHHPEVDQMACHYCDQSFAEKTVEGVEARHDTKMLDHMVAQHAGEEFGLVIKLHLECPPCGLVFDNDREQPLHCLEKHGIPKVKSQFCEICRRTYGAPKYVRDHMSLKHFQSQVSICDICGLKCIQRDQLAHHKLTYHGIEPAAEEGHKIITCPHHECDYKAILRNHLHLHIKKKHRERVRRFTCHFCGKTFINSKHLKEHEEIHKNKESKPYRCEICGNSFAVKNYLYIHKRLSHEKRSFPSTNKKKKPRTSKSDRGSESVGMETQDNPATATIGTVTGTDTDIV